MCLVTPILMMSNMASALVRGIGRIATAAVIHVAEISAFLGLLLIFLVWQGGGLKTAFLLTALSPLVAIILSVWVLRDYVTLRPSRFSRWLFKRNLGFGAQISLATFAGFLVYRIDQGILAYMVSAEQLGLYIVAVGLTERLRLLPNAIAIAFLPRLANEMSSRQFQVPMVFRCATIISAGSMLVIAVLCIPAILLAFGMEYSGSITSFLFLLPGVAALGPASVIFSDLLVREKPKYSVWIGYSVLTVNIILNFCLIPFMGIAGAALASTISYLLACLMAILFYRHESGIPIRAMVPNARDLFFVFNTMMTMVKQAGKRVYAIRNLTK
jgi:O-antigen/teichoic acid export membrane protein